jgi:signal peptidase II
MTSFKRNLWIVGIIVAAVLLIDQVVKVWIKTSFNYYDDPVPVFGNWFRLIYIENQGMAFGTTFGSTMWAKLGLSIFRILAIIGIGYYWYKQARRGARTELLVAIGFIFAGATGNLIDSMFYDFIFPYDGCISFNHLEGSGVYTDCGFLGRVETRHTGFLLGNVVDMFQFNMTWPAWMPWVGGSEIFPAIWNIADGSITIGVIMMILRQRVFFAAKNTPEQEERELLGLRYPSDRSARAESDRRSGWLRNDGFLRVRRFISPELLRHLAPLRDAAPPPPWVDPFDDRSAVPDGYCALAHGTQRSC